MSLRQIEMCAHSRPSGNARGRLSPFTHGLALVILTPILLLTSCVGQAFGSATVDSGFEKGPPGYAAYRGAVRVTSDSKLVKSGRRSLEWKYRIVKSKINFIANSGLVRGTLEGRQGLSMWIRSNRKGALIFQLRERGGATYQLYSKTVGKKWQEHRAVFAEFERDPDTRDKNNKLDLSQITEFWIVDASGYLNPKLTGPRTVWVDDIKRVAKFDSGSDPDPDPDSGNVPIIASGPVGVLNNLKSDPMVLREGDTYRMWYGGNRSGKRQQIFHATSKDGRDWKINTKPVLKIGKSGKWDSGDVETPFVLKVGETYHMWYCARRVSRETENWNRDTVFQIGHATSPDGLKWKKDRKNPVIRLGNKSKNEWDWATAGEPSVVHTPNDSGGGQFEMWYVGANVVNRMTMFHIGYATSKNGSDWVKHSKNPVINGSRSFAIPENPRDPYKGFLAPVVFKHADRYIMLHGCEEWNAQPIGPLRCASSEDGIKWELSGEPLLAKGDEDSWCSSGVFGPSVLVENDTVKVWFAGLRITTSYRFGIGYREFPVECLR